MILTRSKALNWSLFLRWMLASALALVLGLSLADLLTKAAGRLLPFDPDRFFAGAALLSVGLMLGLAQSQLGGPVLPASGRWVRATVLGCLPPVLPLVADLLPGMTLPRVLADAILFAFIGGALGLAQWTALRHKHHAAGWWIPANAVGLMSFLVLSVFPAGSMQQLIYIAALLGLFFAVPSGACLLWYTHWPRAAVK